MSVVIILFFTATVDVSVSDQVPEGDFSGEYRDYATVGEPADSVVGDVIAQSDTVRDTRWGVMNYAGAYEYEGTVYIVEQSPMYIDFGLFEFRPFGR